FLMIVAFSPGMFHASTAFLPSSFTMYMSMLGLSAFLDWRGEQKTAQGIMWFGLGAIVGWPFAGALVIPLLLEEFVIGFISSSLEKLFFSVVDGTLQCLSILVYFVLLPINRNLAVILTSHRLLKLLSTMSSSKSS